MDRVALVLAAGAFVLSSCAFGPEQTTRLERTTPAVITIFDEDRRLVPGATYEWAEGSASSDDEGRIAIELSRPIAGVVTAPGAVPEPLVVSPRDRSIEVTLFAREGPNGVRTALHFGGDVMLGRRYQDPNREGTAVAFDAESAREVVSDLAPIAAAADFTIVNAETVIGRLDPNDAYPGKRFLLQSPPYIVDMLEALGVDLVTLGNNHAYDWLDAGVTSTLDVLGAAAMPHTGAGLDPTSALTGQLVTVGQQNIGIVSVTTVNGSFVNDQLPTSASERPTDVPDNEAWQYVEREFGFGEPGEPGHFPAARRRAGDAWQEYAAAEDLVSEERAAQLWSAITADDAYPELQDWVARRGHGGAAAYNRIAVADEIAALRSNGADIVVVQFHAGFQFAEVKSTFVRRISHRAIDDGADLVVSHHPHVLQGVEWYNGSLIAYSLGNLVFDQDFLSTFPSAILRVVVDNGGLIEARLLPVMLVNYRPVPVAGDAAERIVRRLNTRSTAPAESERVDGFEVDSVLVSDTADGVETASVDFVRNSGLIGTEQLPGEARLTAGPFGSATLPPCLSLRADQLPLGVEYGVDLFGWGGFDDVTADGARGDPMHWITPADPSSWSLVQGQSLDPSDDALRLITNANRRVSARFVARVPVAEHRIFDTDDGRPADAPPIYTIELNAKRERGESAIVRIDAFHVDDSNPTSDPVSTRLRRADIPFSVPDSAKWEQISIPLEASIFEPVGELSVDALMVTLMVEPAFRGQFTFDDVRMLEWRGLPLTRLPLWTEIDGLRADDAQTVNVTVSGCSSG